MSRSTVTIRRTNEKLLNYNIHEYVTYVLHLCLHVYSSPCARDPLGNSKLFIKRETKNENWPSTRKLLGIKMRIHAHFQLCTERK